MPDFTTTPSTPSLPQDLNTLQNPQVAGGPQLATIDAAVEAAFKKSLEAIASSPTATPRVKFDLTDLLRPPQKTMSGLLHALGMASSDLNPERNAVSPPTSPGANIGSSGSDPWNIAEQDMRLHLQTLLSPTSPGPMQHFGGTGSPLSTVQALLSSAQQQTSATPRIALAP